MNFKEETFVFKTIDGLDLKLYCFRPTGLPPGQTTAGIVFFHGGGWIGGEAAQFFQQSRHLAARGIWAASAEYRTANSNEHTPLDCLSDGKSALRWIRAHAGGLGIDPLRLAAGGGSAGAHVAACTALLDGFDDRSDDLTVSCKPNALVLFNPVIDTTETGWLSGHRMLGDKARLLSPIHLVSPGAPPTLVQHGTNDQTTLFENAERFQRCMRQAGNDCELIPFPGLGHGFFNAGRDDGTPPFSDTMRHTVQFLTRIGFLDAGLAPDKEPS